MLKIGIIGLPNVGKSTLFSALTSIQVDISNYPFCTIEPNRGIVPVKDERLDQLAGLHPDKKKIPAAIEFVDIAGLIRNAHKGEGLGNQFLSHIRNVDVIAEVIRAFEDSNIEHTEPEIHPLKDQEVIQAELILSDLEILKKKKSTLAKEKKGTGKEAEEAGVMYEILTGWEEKLNRNEWLYPLKDSNEHTGKLLGEVPLLSVKPLLYIINTREGQGSEKIQQFKKKYPDSTELDIKLEKEIAEMDKAEIEELEVKSSLQNIVRHSYQLLNTLTFFTIGDDEVRAWTGRKGITLPQAGGIVHTDFEKKFIRAEVIDYRDLTKAGSIKNAREKGIIRTEGKDYQVKDGEVIKIISAA